MAVIPLVVILLIFINNLIVLVTFKRMKKLQIQHHFMIGLAVADLLTSIPYIISLNTLLRGHITITENQCNALAIWFSQTFQTTACIHSVMCIEKCVSVFNPLAHRSFRNNTKISRPVGVGVLISCFALPVLLNVVLLYSMVVRFEFISHAPTCIFAEDTYTMAVEGCCFVFIPMLIQLGTNIPMVIKAMQMRGTTRRRTVRAMKTVTLTVGVYYVCYIPAVVEILWVLIFHTRPAGILEFLALQAIMLNSTMSLVIYSYSLPKFSARLKIRPSFSPPETQETT